MLWLLLSLSFPLLAAENFDCKSEAKMLGNNSQIELELGFAGELKFFRLIIVKKGLLTLSSTGTTDTAGILYDENCGELGVDDNNGDDKNFSLEKPLTEATYYIGVRLQSGDKPVTVGLKTVFTVAESKGEISSDTTETVPTVTNPTTQPATTDNNVSNPTNPPATDNNGATNTANQCRATYDAKSGILTIPCVDVTGAFGSTQTFKVGLQQRGQQFIFDLGKVELVNR